MSKTTTLYVSMIVVFVVGLWAIVHVGRSLRAPHDLSGTWAVADGADAATTMPATAGSTWATGTTSAGAKTLAVAQSGRFVKVKVDGGAAIDMVMQSQTDAGGVQQMAFKGGGQEMTVRTAPPTTAPDEAAGPYQFTLRGPVNGTYSATREAVAVKNTKAAH